MVGKDLMDVDHAVVAPFNFVSINEFVMFVF